jgi:hypothetical protein
MFASGNLHASLMQGTVLKCTLFLNAIIVNISAMSWQAISNIVD